MEIPKNIWFNPALNARRKAGTLTIADNVLIGVATFTADLFPAMETAIGNKKQDTKVPSFAVRLYQQSNSKRLANTDEFTFGVEITYVPKDSADRAEISHAVFLILQGLDTVQSGVGVFRCTDKNSDMTDGLGHVTANISVREIQPDNSVIIEKATKEVNL